MPKHLKKSPTIWENYCSSPCIIDAESLAKIVNAFYCIQQDRGIHQKVLHLTGLEPTLWKDRNNTIIDLVEFLQKEGLQIELTTNGSKLTGFAKALARAGVSKIRLSLSSASSDKYFFMTGKNCFSRVMRGLEAVCQEDIEVKINYLLTWETYRDVLKLIPFVNNYNIILKLMKLHWSTTTNKLNYIDPLEVFNNLLFPFSSGQSIKHSDSPIRTVIRYPLKDGGTVEIKLPVKGSLATYFPFCRVCEYLHHCDEATSLVPPSVWLTPELNLIFCPLRKKPRIELKNLMDSKTNSEIIKEYIAYNMDHMVFHGEMPYFPLPVRATITSYCNMSCIFCHAEGHKRNDLTQPKER
jgi:molybdenum cofactor biosynthesis enzyme MoaA